MSRPGVDSTDFLFPASPREERSKVTRQNHDAYKMWDAQNGPTKLPLSIKTTSAKPLSYDIPSLSMKSVMSPVLHSVGTDSISDLFAMATLEHLGESSSYQETVLDYAGHCLNSTIQEKLYKNIISGFEV